jgi:hypothetical protein
MLVAVTVTFVFPYGVSISFRQQVPSLKATGTIVHSAICSSFSRILTD